MRKQNWGRRRCCWWKLKRKSKKLLDFFLNNLWIKFVIGHKFIQFKWPMNYVATKFIMTWSWKNIRILVNSLWNMLLFSSLHHASYATFVDIGEINVNKYLISRKWKVILFVYNKLMNLAEVLYLYKLPLSNK